jgi:hypothetical protein
LQKFVMPTTSCRDRDFSRASVSSNRENRNIIDVKRSRDVRKSATVEKPATAVKSKSGTQQQQQKGPIRQSKQEWRRM